MKANLLRGAMAEAGMTQKQLAAALGITENTMSRKMCGHQAFNTEEVLSICKLLRIDDLTRRAEIFLS